MFPRARLFRRCLALAALACVACASQEAPRTPEREQPARPVPAPAPVEIPRPEGDPIRIVVLGDSIAAGFGLPEQQAFPARTQALLRGKGHPVDVLNAGVSGDTTAGGLSRLDWVLRSEPHILVVELGGNDALRGQRLQNTERNLAKIARRATKAGARVLLLGMDVPTNYGAEYGGGFNALFPRVAREEEIELLPGFIREVGLDSSLMMPDGIHPTAEGHERLAALLAERLEEILLDL